MESAARPAPKLGRLARIGIWGIAAAALLLGFGFFAAPPILKSVLVTKLGEFLHRDVRIGSIDVNPLELSARLADVTISDRARTGPFLAFGEIAVDLHSMSLVRLAPVISSLTIRAPRVTVVREKDGRLSFADILEELARTPPSPEPARFSLNNVRIEGGQVRFEDRLAGRVHDVTGLDVGVPFISNLPDLIDINVEPSLKATVNGTQLAFHGRTKPFAESRESTLDLELSAVDLPGYMAYLPPSLPVKLASGLATTKLAIAFVQQKSGPRLEIRGDLVLDRIALHDARDRPLASVERVSVPVETADVLGRTVKLGAVKVEGPRVEVTRDRNGAINWAALGSAPGTPSKPSPRTEPAAVASGPGLTISARSVTLSEGTVKFSDQSVDPPFQATLGAIAIGIEDFSTAAGAKSRTRIALKTDAGETLSHEGSFSLAPLEVEGRIEAGRVAVPRYAPYYAPAIAFRIDEATVDLAGRFRYGGASPEALTLSELEIALKALRVTADKEELLKLASATVRGGNVDLVKRSATVVDVALSQGSVRLRRDRDGSLNVARLLAPPGAAGPTPARTAGAAGPVPWRWSIGKVALDRLAVAFLDQAPADPVSITADPVSATVTGLSSDAKARLAVALQSRINQAGTLTVSGPVTLDPVTADLKLDAQGIDVLPFQPYFTDRVRINLASGSLAVQGALALELPAGAPPRVGFTGTAGVTRLASTEKATAEEFLRWESLFVSGIRVGVNPTAVEIDDIALTDFYSRLIVNADGTLNLQGIVLADAGPATAAAPRPEPSAPPPAPPAPPAAPEARGPAVPVKIGRVTLQGGRVNFSDRFIRPNYSANLTELGGRVSGLSSDPQSRAEVDLKGNVDSHAPLTIAGTVNPLGRGLFLDLKAAVRGFELSPLSPYSGKYVGYGISKGKLSLDVKYRIENRKLTADNNVFLDQLTFGEKIESPDAIKLPVLLAVSLLKNRKGEIDIQLPVGGSLDDPQFSVGGIVFKVIVNLLTKIITSPFALLGSLFGGGGEELSYLEFDFGRSSLDADAGKKLGALAKALNDRPALRLEITGRTDLERDKEGVRRYQFERKLKTQKFNELVKKGTPPASVDEVTIGGDERQRFLEAAYRQETFPKPRNLIGLAKDLPPAEMEKLILTHIVVSEDDVRQLAVRRAQAAKDYIVKAGPVEPERVFLVNAAAAQADGKSPPKAKDARVDFALR